ncbi:MAG: type VI secretion system tip protein VgrG [Lysobacterales bacterium]
MPNLSPQDTNVPIQLKTPLGDNVLLVRSIRGKEKVSGLFVFHLDLISENPGLEFDKTVGQNITAVLLLDDAGEERYFNGFITEFRYSGKDGQYYRYQATIRPWLWLLTRTSDCRIFQKTNMTVPDIIKDVFKINNMVDFDARLSATYRIWDYCVQYNESDFDFISRLMEQEGIYYYFEHKADKHVLVLADDASAHNPYAGYEEIQYLPDLDQGSATAKALNTWTAKQHMMPNMYATKDYDFENPKLPLLSKYSKQTGHEWPNFEPEIYDYPGEYVTGEEGKTYAEIRLQELMCQRERVHASGQCRGLVPGCMFTLWNYPRDDQNKEYLILSIEHEMNNHEFMSGAQEDITVYESKIEVIAKDKLPFRAPRKTRKPKVQGPQTAVVVGPKDDEANSEIYTDKYGRIKVQFHWDRYGDKDEKSSCWVRVSQLWAGAKWGGIHIPRIGQEVVVSFLDGDPDRPLITGSVYNANYMPPYELTTNKSQSGIKSRSTTGGSADNFNEIRFEDKIGEEELYIHAEKNHTNITENDRSENVGHDRSCKVGHDYKLDVGNDALVNIGYEGDAVGSYTMNVCKDRIETVSNGDYKIGVDTGSRELFIKSNDKVEVKGSRKEVIAKTLDSQCKDLKLTGSATMVAKSQSVKIHGAATTYIGDTAIKVSGTTIDVNGTTINITGSAGVNITCGGASVKLSAGGVKISGPMVNINT